MANDGWIEITHGALRESTPSPYRYQIAEMECEHCDFMVKPASFRRFDAERKDHPRAYGNFASIAHARKLMRDHLRSNHAGLEKVEQTYRQIPEAKWEKA